MHVIYKDTYIKYLIYTIRWNIYRVQIFFSLGFISLITLRPKHAQKVYVGSSSNKFKGTSIKRAICELES